LAKSQDPETFREVFTNTTKFSKRTGLYEVLGSEFLGEGLLTSSGALWHSERKTITNLFHYKSLQKVMVPITQIASQMIDFLSSTNGKPIASPFVSDWTMKIVVGSSFGILPYFIAFSHF
jgi:cytochrome P450